MENPPDIPCRSCRENDAARPQWGAGPWTEEPNRQEFEHAGLPCIIHRGGSGAWCGYVGVKPGHPLHRLGYNDDKVNVEVHGGLTYSEKCAGHICHVAKPGEPDDVWWFGFDCAHSWDVAPGLQRFMDRYEFNASYKDVFYAIAETERLARQLAAVTAEAPAPEAAP